MTGNDALFTAPSDETAITVVAGRIGADAVQTVNARDLHAFLEIGKDFSTWMKARIEQYDFVEGRDFVVVRAAPQNGGAGNRGARTEYALTIDMAKELAMVERNERGRRARAYFIECERRAKAATAAINVRDPSQLAQIAVQLIDMNRELQGQVDTLAPKAEALDRIATADGSLNITAAAKALQVRPKDLFAYLRQHGWIYKRAGSAGYLGYQARTNAGDLEHKVTTVLRADGSEKIVEQVLVTAKGLAKLAALMRPAVQAA